MPTQGDCVGKSASAECAASAPASGAPLGSTAASGKPLLLMRDFQDSTLWEISGFEQARRMGTRACYTGQLDTTQLGSTLQGELDALGRERASDDVLEIFAAVRRHRHAALIYLDYQRLVWPVTLFPLEMAYHSPRDLLDSTLSGLRTLRAVSVEPPGVLPPGAWAQEADEASSWYRPLTPVLWRVALEGPRPWLLHAIGGAAAYRLLRDPREEGLAIPAGMAPALSRLDRGAVSLRELASLRGMTLERSARLLNALYLCANLVVSRAGPATRREPFFGLLRRRATGDSPDVSGR